MKAYIGDLVRVATADGTTYTGTLVSRAQARPLILSWEDGSWCRVPGKVTEVEPIGSQAQPLSSQRAEE